MEKNKEISPEDTIRLVRVAIKCADCLIDFDVLYELMEEKKSKYIKHNVKTLLIRSGEYIDKFSSAFLKPFVEADENTEMELQTSFRDLSTKILFGNWEMTCLVLYYSKLKSIQNDLSEMTYTDSWISYLNTVCKEFTEEISRKYKMILAQTDSSGHGVPDIIEGLDKLGKTIMYHKNEKTIR